jgi:hypothetical protein
MRSRLFSFTALLALLPVGALAQAAAPPPAEFPYNDTSAILVQAIERGDWALVVVAGLVLATFIARKMLTPLVPFLSTDAGGVLLSLVGLTSSLLCGSLVAGVPLSASLVVGSVLTAASASGLWGWGSKLATAAKASPAEVVKSGSALLVLLALSSQVGCASARASYYRASPEECRQMTKDRNLWGASAAGAGVVGGGLGGVSGLVESQDARTAIAVSALVLAGVTAFAGYVTKGLDDQHGMYCTEPASTDQPAISLQP